jgi:hypothetical protein
LRILIGDPTYPENFDRHDEFVEGLRSDLRREFRAFDLDDVDAGPGAADPAFFLTMVEIAALVLTFYAAPKTIQESLPIWRGYFDKLQKFLKTRRLDYSIDAKSAATIAVQTVLEHADAVASGVRVVSTLRLLSVAGEFSVQTVNVDEPEKLSSHELAVSMRHCQYIVSVDLDGSVHTVIVGKDGSCLYHGKL